MKSFIDNYLHNLRLPSTILTSTGLIREFKGKEDIYKRQSQDVLDRLLEIAKIQSAESSSRIEGVTAPHARIEKLIKENTAPRNRSEQEIAGYRDVLNLIHQSHENIPLAETVVLQFHSMLFRYTGLPAGAWKKIDNEIIEIKPDGSRAVRFKTVPWGDTPFYMNKLIVSYNEMFSEHTFDALILMPLFVLDFLCIHPFIDGNGRVGRLLTLLLLYQAGYRVGKYISLERIVEESKESYYAALHHASIGWHEGKHDIMPWLEYFYGILIAAYQEFEGRVGLFRGKGSKTEQIKAQIERFIAPFSISDLEEACPNTTRDMIRKILRELRDESKLKVIGIGRNAKWIKIG
jgi:Fic family protein